MTLLLSGMGCAPTSSRSATPLQTITARPATPPPRPQPLFREVGKEAGLEYIWKIPGKRPLTILQTIGNGCAFFDANGDGNLDILLVGTPLALYLGDGKGKFTDVSKESGVSAFTEHYLGCAVGDYDNDGDPDLYISGWRTALFLRNEGVVGNREQGIGNSKPNTENPKTDAIENPIPDTQHSIPVFKDVTGELGFDPQPWGGSCGFADLDNDGWLDLYVTNYVTFGPEVEPQLCKFKGIMTGCGPVNYDPEFGVLYHNEGGKRFKEVTKSQAKGPHGKGLGVAFADFDRSGRVSFLVANDLMPTDLFVNQGKGKFKNQGEEAGISFDESGETYAGMGVDWGDYDNDGQPDFYISNFRNEIKRLYKNTGYGSFEIDTVQAGVNQPTLPFVGWGCKFFDADNDGWLDLLLANGHVQDNIQKYERTTYRQPTLFLHNQGGARPVFKNATKGSGLTALPTIVGRGLAVGDYDNDGRVDALVVDSEGRPLLLHNETATPENSWVGFRLIGIAPNNRDAYGAKVRVVSGKQKLIRQCQPGGSYLSSSDPRVHFGLPYSLLDAVTITWPDGTTQSWTDLAPGRYYTVKQGRRPE